MLQLEPLSRSLQDSECERLRPLCVDPYRILDKRDDGQCQTQHPITWHNQPYQGKELVPASSDAIIHDRLSNSYRKPTALLHEVHRLSYVRVREWRESRHFW